MAGAGTGGITGVIGEREPYVPRSLWERAERFMLRPFFFRVRMSARSSTPCRRRLDLISDPLAGGRNEASPPRAATCRVLVAYAMWCGFAVSFCIDFFFCFFVFFLGDQIWPGPRDCEPRRPPVCPTLVLVIGAVGLPGGRTNRQALWQDLSK